jgi:hypothetical protein
VADVQLAEPAQLPAHVVQVEHADLVDPQADVGLQPPGRVVPRGRDEPAAVASSSRHPANGRSISASAGGTCFHRRRGGIDVRRSGAGETLRGGGGVFDLDAVLADLPASSRAALSRMADFFNTPARQVPA